MVRCVASCLLLALLGIGAVHAQPLWEPAGSIRYGGVSGVITNEDGDPMYRGYRGIRLKLNGVWTVRSGVSNDWGPNGGLARSSTGTLYFGAYYRTWMSTDNGRTWGVSGRVDSYRSAMSIDAIYSNADTLKTPAKSTDDGASWRSITPPFAKSIGNIIASDNATTIFARVRSGDLLSVSTDGGSNWREINEQFGGSIIDAVVPGPSVHFVATFDNARAMSRLFRSIDEGATWQMVSEAPGHVTGLRAVSSSLVFELRSGWPYRSTDGGNTWNQIVIGTCPEDMSQFVTVYSSPQGVVFLGSGSYGLWSSTDQGITWTEEGLLGLVVPDFVASYHGTLYSAGYMDSGWESDDNGSTWGCSTSVPQVIDSAGRWFRTERGLEISTDRGRTWTNPLPFKPTSINEWRVYGPVITPRGTFIATFNYEFTDRRSGVYRSRDGSQLQYPLSRFEFIDGIVMVSPQGTVYFLSDSMFRSTDDGVSWSFVTAEHGQRNITTSHDETLYAMTGAVGSWIAVRSTDMGDSWQPITSVSDSLVWLMPAGVHGVIALVRGTDSLLHLRYSPDHGDHFVPADAGLGTARPVALIGEFGGTFFLSTDRGMYRTASLADVNSGPASGVADSIAVWPIPARDLLYVRVQATSSTAIPIDIVENDGKIVFSTTENISADGSIHIDIRRLASGSYTISTHLKGRAVSSGFIVVR